MAYSSTDRAGRQMLSLVLVLASDQRERAPAPSRALDMIEERVLAPVCDPDFAGACLLDSRSKLVPIRVVGDHQWQLDPLLPPSGANPHPARGKRSERISEAARPAIGNRARRRQHDLDWKLNTRGVRRRLELAELHPETLIQRATSSERTVEIDRPLISRIPQQFDHPLSLAEPISADHMGAFREQRARLEQLGDLVFRVAMPEHRKREGRLGDEEVARNELKRRASWVARALIVSGDDGVHALIVDHHLRAAEHVACGHELDADIADLERLSIGERLCAA